MPAEPTTTEAIHAWIDEHVSGGDIFADVAAATAAHREVHGCDAFEGGDGPMLGVFARACRSRRLLEVGTALGYGALWLSHGGGPDCSVDTIEHEPAHAELATEQFARHGVSNITILVGSDLDVLDQLEPTYDLIVYDAGVPTAAHLDRFERLLASGGLLISSNLFLGRYVPELPGLAEGARYREALFGENWLTAFANTKAISIRR